MAFTLTPEHFKHLHRYQELARLYMKYGRGDLLKDSGLESMLSGGDGHKNGHKADEDAPVDPKAEDLAHDLEKMGPIFVKLGQVLSSRTDLLPPDYVKALSRLQDELAPVSFDAIEETIQSELGVRISKAYQEFDAEPLATASLGQVHRAVLRDGRPVVVKVQRPDIRERVEEDMEVLRNVAALADSATDLGRKFRFSESLEEFQKNLLRELDYQQEAQNLLQIGENLEEFDRIVVPRPVLDFSTSRVLTMDYIRGKKITALSPLGRMEIDGKEMAEQVFRAYLKMILVDGIFHADPHPGNILLTDDGKVALIDLGMIGYLGPVKQQEILKFLLAVSEGRADEAAEIAMRIGEQTEDFNEKTYKKRVADLVNQNQNVTVANFKIGQVMADLSKVSGDSGIRIPSELTMLSKALLNLDEIGRTLDPNFDPNEAIREYGTEITRRQIFKSMSPSNLFSTAMEAREFTQELPGRVNKILDAVANNNLRIHVEAIDELTLIDGFQKIANRITTGLILASLIIGAAMLMQVQTRFQIWGYPGLAMILFMLAAGGGVWLVISILLSDHDVRSERKQKS